MPYQDEARKILYEVLNKLDRQEQKEMILLANKWGVVANTLNELIQKLAEKEIKSANQLYQLELYKEFLAISKNQVTKFSADASTIIARNQVIFAEAGLSSTQEMIELVTVRFNRLPIQAVNNMIGFSSDGSPLYELLKKSYPETVDKLIDTLISSTALGRNPQVTARLMKESMDGNLSRALRIARTEQMNVLRETSRMQMEKSGVVSEWERIEQEDACEDCAAENGKRYSLGESFDTHPNCRGSLLPIVE